MLDIVIENTAKKCFKPLVMAYKDIDASTFNKIQVEGDINDHNYLE